MKPVTYEETKEQEREFRARHPDWQHQPVGVTRAQAARLWRVWEQLLQRQNGRDLDDYVMPEEHRLVRYGREFAPAQQYKRLLLVGVGVGREVLAAREAGYEVQGITLGPMNVAFAREQLGVELLYLDAHATGLPAGSFDAVMALQTLEHSWAPLVQLIEFCRLLRPGGMVIVETPAASEWTMGRDLHHALCPTPRQLQGLLLKAGFLDVKPGLQEGNGVTLLGNYRALDTARENAFAVGTRFTPERAEEVEPVIRRLMEGAP